MASEGQPLTFTVDWFSHNISTWTRILQSVDLLDSHRAVTAVEVGSWEGRSAAWLLQRICAAPGSLLACIDTWRGFEQYADVEGQYGLSPERHTAARVEGRFDANMAALGAGARLLKLKGDSVPCLRRLQQQHSAHVDLVYLDGSHRPEDIAADAEAAWPLLRRGGVLIFDDYAWHEVVELGPGQRPREAIDAFLDEHAQELIVLDLAYQCIVQKTGECLREADE